MNYFDLIISQVIIIAWLVIDYYTGKHIYEKTYNSISIEETRSFNYKYFFYSIIILFMNVIYNMNLNPETATILSLLSCVALMSLYTDPLTHLVNRHSLRFVYITMICLFINNSNANQVIFYSALYFVLLFFVSSIGASDVRALYIMTLTYYFLDKENHAEFFAIHLFVISLLHLGYSENRKNESIPICHWILVPLPIVILLKGFWN